MEAINFIEYLKRDAELPERGTKYFLFSSKSYQCTFGVASEFFIKDVSII